METTFENIGEALVLTVNYEALDAKSGKDFRQDFDGVAGDGSQIVLDLGNVEFIDSAGLGAIVASLKKLRSMNGDLKICNVNKPVMALFELVRMHKLVDIFASREEALA